MTFQKMTFNPRRFFILNLMLCLTTSMAFADDTANQQILTKVVTKTDDSFEKVIRYLSPQLEAQANYLIIVNTTQPVIDQALNRDFIRPQHLIVVERKTNGPLLPRRKNGTVDVGALQRMKPFRYNIKDNNTRWQAANTMQVDSAVSNQIRNIYQEVPISSGLRNPSEQMIQTFTGIFRVNARRSLEKHTESPLAEMSNSLYVDHVYADSGTESGLAVHGVPDSWWGTFGLQRFSEGCIRTAVAFNQQLYAKVMNNSANYPAQMPLWDRKSVFPDNATYNGTSNQSITAPRALIILFDRFDGTENQPEI